MATGVLPITLDGYMARVREPFAEEVRPLLTIQERVFQPGSEHGWTSQPHPAPQYETERDGIAFSLHLVPHLQECLQRQGRPVQIEGHWYRPWRLSTVDREWVTTLDQARQQLLGQLHGAGRGWLRVESDRQAWTLAADLVRLYPQARIIVTTANRVRVERLAYHLRQSAQTRVQTLESLDFGHPTRVLVCTTRWLGDCHRDDWDLVIAVDGHSAGMPAHWSRLIEWQGGAGYALLRHTDRITNSMSLRLLARYGPELTFTERTDPDLLVIALNATSLSRTNHLETTNILTWKRNHLWHNHTRNALLARIAKALLHDDHHELAYLGIADLTERNPGLHGTLILVESPEHARILKAQLDEWTICANEDTHPHSSRGIIGTLTWWLRKPQNAPSYIINGSLIDPVSLNRKEHQGRTTLIEMLDQHDNMDRTLIQNRMKQYQKRNACIIQVMK